MYEYLIGDLILGVVWLFAFLYRKDLRKSMVWSGFAYLIIISILYIVLKIVSLFVYLGEPIFPGYWYPNTLFGIGEITGGYAIEDALFMFFAGGFVSFIYEFLFKEKIKFKKNNKNHFRALVISAILSFVYAGIFNPNPIYPLIAFGVLGGFFICVERRDLIKHSIYGGVSFLTFYFIFFLIFNFIFPYFMNDFYNLGNLSGVLILGIPLEELLYALSFGLVWAPMYEYEHGVRNLKFK